MKQQNINREFFSYMWRINVNALQKNFKDHIMTFPRFSNMQFTGPVLFIGGGASDYIKLTLTKIT